MKRLIAIALCLIAAPCWAGGAFGPFGIGMGSKGAGGASCCPDTGHASLLCEDFDGSSDCGNDANGDTNCRYGWTVSGEGSGSSIDFTTTHSGTFNSAYKGTNAVTLTDGDAAAYGPKAYYRFGTNVSVEYVQFYFNVTVGVTSNTQYVAMMGANQSTTYQSNDGWRIEFYRSSTTGCGGSSPGYQLTLKHHNGTTVQTDTSDVTTLCTNTWYGVRVYYKYNDANGIAWAIDYDLDGTFTDQSVADPHTTTRYADYLWMSAYNATASYNPAVQLDMVEIDATDYPAAKAP